MLPLLSFLLSPLGRIVGIIGLVGFVLVSIWIGIKVHDAGIRREARAEFNRQQIQLVLKEQADQKKRWEAFELKQTELLERLDKKAAETQDKVDGVEAYLRTPEAAKSDRPASDVLKETLKRLGAPK